MKSLLVICGIRVVQALILHTAPVSSEVLFCTISQTQREKEDNVTEKELKKMNKHTRKCCHDGSGIKNEKYELCEVDGKIDSDSFQNCCAKSGLTYVRVDEGDSK